MSTPETTSLVKPFVSLDSLEDDLVESWQVVSQATQRFLRLLREFDLRQGWRASGNTDCAGWLNWRCGISRTTAQEKVRVARALWGLPKIDAAFARGALSYSKVRALTRVASPRNEVALLDHALRSSAAGLEAYCRRLRNGDAEWSEKDAARARAGRSLTRYFRDDGTALLSVELPRAEVARERAPRSGARGVFLRELRIPISQPPAVGLEPRGAGLQRMLAGSASLKRTLSAGPRVVVGSRRRDISHNAHTSCHYADCAWTNAITSSLIRPGSSSIAKCPQSGKTCRVEPGTAAWSLWAHSTTCHASFSPQRICTGSLPSSISRSLNSDVCLWS